MTNEELVEKIQKGIDVQENMGKLYEQNYEYIKYLVYSYAKMLKTSNVFEIEDLLQESYFSICNAIEKYDANKGIKFISFAASFIKLNAKRFIESKLSTVNVSVNKTNLAWRYELLKREYGVQSDSFFAKKLNISNYRFSEIKKIAQASKTLSMDCQNKDDESESTLHNLCSSVENVEDEVIEKIKNEKVSGIWNIAKDICNEKEFEVIKKHFKYNMSFQKIGSEMGKCAEIARKHKVNALQKMQLDERMIEIAEIYFDYTPKCAFHYGVGRFKNERTSSTEFIALKHIEKEKNLYEYWLSENGISKIKKWVELGMMKQQIASKIGISRQTLQRWRKQYPKIAEIFDTKKVK